MERRDFLKSAVAGGVAASKLRAAGAGIPKRPYRDDVKLSIIAFGGIVAMGMPQAESNRIVAQAFDRGVNYFDVAPTYGDGEAEQKLGPALEPYRKRVFLACKTTERGAQGAQRELEQSLRRLKTDHFDLYQFHAVTKMSDVEQIFAPGGAAETFVKAREQGKVRYLGFSAHSVEAALAMLDRFQFDSILFPINYVCFAQGNFGPQVIQRAKEKGVARLALKALAKTTLPKGEAHNAHPKCWYEPVDDPALAEKALRFTLSQDITAAVPPGDDKIYPLALDIASRFKPLTESEQSDLLASAKGLEPIFRV